MTRPSILITLGIIIVLLPFSGLPIGLRSFILPILGLAVLVVGISLRAPRALPPLESATTEPAPPPASLPTHPQAMG